MARLISLAEWQSAVSYYPETGRFFWKQRPAVTKYEKAWNARFAGAPAGSITQSGYVILHFREGQYLAHRIAWLISYGSHPVHNIDHINGNRTDNRLCNLRDVPQALNLRNVRLSAKSKSGYPGVHFRQRDKIWVAQIYDGNGTIYLGSSKDFDEAVAMRKLAEGQLGYHPNHGRVA